MKTILPIILLFLFNNLIAQDNKYFEFNLQLLNNEKNIEINYYNSFFVTEDSVEYVDFVLDTNLTSHYDKDHWELQIPYDSHYLIEVKNLSSNKIKYIQISTGSNLAPNSINIPIASFDNKTRLVIYYKDSIKDYVQFITNEP